MRSVVAGVLHARRYFGNRVPQQVYFPVRQHLIASLPPHSDEAAMLVCRSISTSRANNAHQVSLVFADVSPQLNRCTGPMSRTVPYLSTRG